MSDFSDRLIAWQRRHGRHDLPWQNTRDAYRIWLSEIMLQQTQVATVIPYYGRFLEAFPTIADLAAAPLERVLELWAGLGYYARARNLHACAVAVVRDHGGAFPRDPAQIAELPGIGRSTAAAIAAFAYGHRGAILDGNVKRVLTRCFGVAGFPGAPKVEKGLWQLADSLLPACNESGEIEAYTQGIMDLGASLCARRRPTCALCPMHDICVARREGRQDELPEAKPSKALPERHTICLVISDGPQLLVERRPPTGIWGGLLALPEIDDAARLEETLARYGCRLEKQQTLAPFPHTFSHFRLHITPLLCRVSRSGQLAADSGDSAAAWIDWRDTASAALPAPLRKLLRDLDGLPPGLAA